MGHESQIELWSPNMTTFCFVGFGTDRLRRQEAMKTAGKENPNRCAITWQPTELLERKLEPSLLNQSGWKGRKHPAVAKYFFLTFPFIELIRVHSQVRRAVMIGREANPQLPLLRLLKGRAISLVANKNRPGVIRAPGEFLLLDSGRCRGRKLSIAPKKVRVHCVHSNRGLAAWPAMDNSGFLSQHRVMRPSADEPASDTPLILLIMIFAAVPIIFFGARYGMKIQAENQAQAKRDATYQATLHSYSQILKLGMNRKKVEDYLRVNKMEFFRLSLDDLAQIGEDKSQSWGCGNVDVFMEFAFTAATQREGQPNANEMDTLNQVEIIHRSSGCL